MASDSLARSLALAALQYREEHAYGDYNQIANKPKLNGKLILGSHNADYYNLPLLDETANKIQLLLDSDTYKLKAQLLNKANEVIDTSAEIDLPLEELVMSGEYRETSEGQFLVLTLKNGNEVLIPLEGLIDELATITYVDFQDDYLEYKINSEGNRLETLILNEANMRSSEDEWIHELLVDHQEAIDAEIEARELGDSELEARMKLHMDTLLDSEATLRLAGDSELKGLIDKETEERLLDYAELSGSIDQEVANRTSEDDSIRRVIANTTSEFTSWLNNLNNSLNSESQIRSDSDISLSALIDSEANKRELQVSNLETRLNAEATARSTRDDQLANMVAQESNTRSNEDTRLETLINNKKPLLDQQTIKENTSGRLYVPIDWDTIYIDANGYLKSKGGGGSSAIQSYLNGVLLDSEATSISAKIYWEGTSEEYYSMSSEERNDPNTLFFITDLDNDPLIQTASYNRLTDKPSINSQVLSGNKTLASLGIQPTMNGVTPISVGGNEVSLRYNESQFYIGADNRLCYYDKVDGFEPNLVFTDGYNGIYGGINVAKYASGLYSGTVRFISLNALTAGTEYKVASSFGDGSDTFSSYCFGFDDLTYTPMCVKITNGEVYIYPTINIPARSVIGFTFIANN